ncbi:hypothetical protein C2845_PM12G30560 [Panicum miliaceum]|uniref:F-box protein n=1 Tax=Panicum miliaceum TaxID=4540 RepID=A0A3L6QHM2_PANMI|nr:hypothetical protein C2845_PM12G30560 [Panicum miliaceum]
MECILQSTVRFRFAEVAKLRYVWWLKVRGRIRSKMLSQDSTYAAYIVFKTTHRHGHGLDYPPQEASITIAGSTSTHTVCLQYNRSHRHEFAGNLALFPNKRTDGWMELEMGQFYNKDGDDGERRLRDACHAAAVSPAFRAAADSDAVWACFVPRDVPPLADGELSPAPPSKKALFTRLCDSPVRLADGLTSMWLDRETGAKCYMLSARALCIIWGDIPCDWGWVPITGSRPAELPAFVRDS